MQIEIIMVLVNLVLPSSSLHILITLNLNVWVRPVDFIGTVHRSCITEKTLLQ